MKGKLSGDKATFPSGAERLGVQSEQNSAPKAANAYACAEPGRWVDPSASAVNMALSNSVSCRVGGRCNRWLKLRATAKPSVGSRTVCRLDASKLKG